MSQNEQKFCLTGVSLSKQFPVSKVTAWLRLRTACATRLLALLLLTLPAVVQAKDYTYTTNNGTIIITGYTGSGGAVTIPSTIDGLPVTSLGDRAFAYCPSLTNVMIPNSVTSIGDSAFEHCTSLAAITVDALNSVYSSPAGVLFNKSQTTLIQYPAGKAGSYTIPNSVTGIEKRAFAYCTRLTSVTIPNSVTSIGDGSFAWCTGLAAITVNALNSVYSDVDGVLFNKSQTTLIQYAPGKAGSYTIPTSVTSIGESAFETCTNLTSVTIPNSVASIGYYAFSWCTRLAGVTIPNGVTSIGRYAFYNCNRLTSVTIPNRVTNIGDGAFCNCTSLTSGTIPSSVASIGEYAFSGCSSLTSVTIPNSVASIGKYAFSWCSSLTSVTIPNSVASIGYGAFASCTNLVAITVDALNSVCSSVDGVLYNKSQTTLIQFPAGKAGSDYTIPNSVAKIGDYAFLGCSSLTSVTIPNSVTSIGDAAFADCTRLTIATIPNGVASIGDSAFAACTSLTSVTIPSSVTSIGYGTFNSCSSLTNVTIPNSVTNIGNVAFDSCTSLTGVYFKGNAPSLGLSVFDGDDNATVYYLAGTTGWDATFAGRPVVLWTLQWTPLFRFETNLVQVIEDSGSVTLTVRLDNGSSPGVSYTTRDGTALAVENGVGDYFRRSGFLAFTNGETSKILTIPIVADYILESNETFEVVLTDPSGGALLGEPSVVTVAILDDDAASATNSFLEVRLPSPADTSGWLRVTLLPSSALGQWRFPWDVAWRNSGLVSGLELGNYDVLFKPVSGYEPPSDRIGTAAVGVTANSETAITSIYTAMTPEFGRLTVTLEPGNLAGVNGWRLQGNTMWNGSGITLSNLPTGQYLVEFKPLAGWATPAPTPVTVFADAESLISANYLTVPTIPTDTLWPTPIQSYSLIRDSLVQTPRRPYALCGQIRTDHALGSGIAVRERAVLTAGHVVFDDTRMAFVDDIYWFCQRQEGSFEPRPLLARGAYVFSGYAAQRQAEATPGQSSLASQDQDVAVLFFNQPAARGGFSGYLMSDVSPNEWLASSRSKTLVGYPTEGDGVKPGRMHYTPETAVVLTGVSNRVHATSELVGYPGSSGGPLCVLHTNNAGQQTFYPAAVYLGTASGAGGQLEARVRAIDSAVVDLINRAATSGDIGTNQSGGVVVLTPGGGSGSTRTYRKLYVNLQPSAAVTAGAGWRLQSSTGAFKTSAIDYATVLSGTNYTIEFRPVAGYDTPTNNTLVVTANQDLRLDAVYRVLGVAPQFTMQPLNQIVVAGRKADFTSLATGTPPLSPQWYLNGALLSQATGLNLQLPAITVTQAGLYWVIVTNWVGAATSAPASLGVLVTDPGSGLWLHGPTGTAYRVDTTTNLTVPGDWSQRGTYKLTNGILRLDGPPWTNESRRFYRPAPTP